MFTVTQQTKRLVGLLTFSVSLLLGQSAYALGTASGTSVANTVSVGYDVSGVPQTTISTANGCVTCSVSFIVDNKVDLSVATSGITNVIPGQTDRVLTFTVVNEGNTAQGYRLAASLGATTFPSPMNNVDIYIEDGTTVGFQLAEDTLYVAGTNAGDLNPQAGLVYVPATDDELIVYVVADVPTSGGGTAPSNGNTEVYNLLATTTNVGTATPTLPSAGAWTPGTLQIVFADAAGTIDIASSGTVSNAGTYSVASAALVVTKLQTVTNDQVGAVVVGEEKAIPGATVRYTLRLDNSGGTAAAENLSVVDVLPGASVTYVGGSTIVDAVAIGDGATVGNITVTITNVGLNNETVTVNGTGFDVPAGDIWDITFDVLVD